MVLPRVVQRNGSRLHCDDHPIYSTGGIWPEVLSVSVVYPHSQPNWAKPAHAAFCRPHDTTLTPYRGLGGATQHRGNAHRHQTIGPTEEPQSNSHRRTIPDHGNPTITTRPRQAAVNSARRTRRRCRGAPRRRALRSTRRPASTERTVTERTRSQVQLGELSCGDWARTIPSVSEPRIPGNRNDSGNTGWT